jgi:IclR family transcriptional regulator, pca regulon regulatory protein
MPKTSKVAPEPWVVPQLREPRYSQSLERGLAIMGCYTSERSVLGIAEIADELGMSRSTTHRYVSTLAVLGFLEQVAERKYRLGLGVTDIGMSALNATGLREHARPYLEELRRLASFSVSLAVLDGPEIVLVDRLSSQRRRGDGFGRDLHPGSRLPAYCTALGKVLLAGLNEPAEVLSGMKLKKQGPNTIVSKNGLRVELERVREEKLAINDEELMRGRCAIAAPVRNSSREVVAAVGIAADTSTISVGDLADALAPHLFSTAARVSARLGYRRGDRQA